MEEVSRKICKEMLDARGYEITEENDDEIYAEKEDDQLVVYFSTENKLKNDQLKYYIKNLDGLQHCIVVYPDKITSIAKRYIDELNVEIELFCAKELQFNITKHRLVPKHEKLPTEEAKKIRKEFGSNLPLILKTDPISRFFNFKRNDIIKITRNDGYVIYRLVK